MGERRKHNEEVRHLRRKTRSSTRLILLIKANFENAIQAFKTFNNLVCTKQGELVYNIYM